MAFNYRLIPSQEHLLRVAVPVCLSNGTASSEKPSLLNLTGAKREDTLDYVMNKNFGIWGVDINETENPFFIGPRVRANIPSYDLVMGIDQVKFDAFTGDLEFPEDDDVSVAHTTEKVSRNISTHVKGKALFDYSEAVMDGNEIVQHYGLRTTSKINLHGFRDIRLTPHQMVVMFVAVPNNREQDPCILKTFASTKTSLEQDLEKTIAMISLAERDYHNFYVYTHQAEDAEWCMVGFLDLAAVLPLYYTHTGVYLQGARDHHELAGLAEEKKSD